VATRRSAANRGWESFAFLLPLYRVGLGRTIAAETIAVLGGV